MLNPNGRGLTFCQNGLTKTIVTDIVFSIVREHYRFRAGTQRLQLGD
jgi:hypothetical protein